LETRKETNPTQITTKLYRLINLNHFIPNITNIVGRGINIFKYCFQIDIAM